MFREARTTEKKKILHWNTKKSIHLLLIVSAKYIFLSIFETIVVIQNSYWRTVWRRTRTSQNKKFSIET